MVRERAGGAVGSGGSGAEDGRIVSIVATDHHGVRRDEGVVENESRGRLVYQEFVEPNRCCRGEERVTLSLPCVEETRRGSWFEQGDRNIAKVASTNRPAVPDRTSRRPSCSLRRSFRLAAGDSGLQIRGRRWPSGSWIELPILRVVAFRSENRDGELAGKMVEVKFNDTFLKSKTS